MNDTHKTHQAVNIITNLKVFNRKERDYLMKFALCDNPGEPRVSPELWNLISRDTSRKPTNPEHIFLGMDYHLNWLYAALATADQPYPSSTDTLPNTWEHPSLHHDPDPDSKPIQGNQQDVDLLVAWVNPNTEKRLSLVLIEAKLDSGWNSNQFLSKIARLSWIRDDIRTPKPDCIDWRFLLLSPGSRPSRNGFDPNQFYGSRKDWILDQDAPGNKKPRLWHERLPVKENLPVEELRHVKRVSEDSNHWTTISVSFPQRPTRQK